MRKALGGASLVSRQTSGIPPWGRKPASRQLWFMGCHLHLPACRCSVSIDVSVLKPVSQGSFTCEVALLAVEGKTVDKTAVCMGLEVCA